jgi:molybdopterin-guanine dinucleotide biosynthesis protein A
VKEATCEICILAGGLSRRMGRDKSRLRLGAQTMLEQIRAEAQLTGLRVRIIRRDAVPRCGPLGGIFTALQTTSAGAILFLACDMPFVTARLMRWLLAKPARHGCFTRHGGTVGFPFLLPYSAGPVVKAQIAKGCLSLQDLAKCLEAKCVRLPRGYSVQLRNINTPVEFSRACARWERATRASHAT